MKTIPENYHPNWYETRVKPEQRHVWFESMRHAFRALGGFKSVLVAIVSIAAGIVFSGVVFYPLARETDARSLRNTVAIDSIRHVDMAMIASIAEMKREQRRRDDWQELQICATHRHANGTAVITVTRELSEELRERCRAVAARLADTY